MRQLKFSNFQHELLGSACDDGDVEVWNIQSRSLHHTFAKAHTMSCTALTFSNVNHLLLCSAGLDQRILFYDISDKRIVKHLECSAPLTALAYHAEGYLIAAGTLYGMDVLWI